MNARSVLFFALLALLVVLASSSSVAASTGVDSLSSSVAASTGVDSLSSPYVVPVPSFNYSSFAAFYTEENFDQPAAFVINMDNVTAFGACTTESPVITIADHNFTSLWVAACSYNDSLLTLDVSIFDSSCGFSNGTYINMTATAAAPSSYSPSLYPISYVLAADGRNETHGVWYTVVHCPLTPSNNESSSTGAAGVSSTGADLSSSTPSISSSYVVPVPSFNYSSFAAFYTEENFDQPAAFVINMEPLTALDSCADEKPVISLAGQSYTNVWAHQCSYNGSLLTLDVSIFNRTCGFDNTTAYVNVTATAVAPTAYSPSLYEVEYAIVADNKTTSSHWYAVVKCPSFAPADSSSSDSSVGVVIGGVVIGVIVVFIVIALLYSRRNRKTVDQTSGNTTDANQAYSRL